MTSPNCKMPISMDTQPEMKVRRSTKPGPRWAFCVRVSLVRIAAMAVGPTGTSLQEPRTVYTKQAIKDE